MRNTSNGENNSFIFATMLKGAETRMSENIISYIYRAVRINEKDTDGYLYRQSSAHSRNSFYQSFEREYY